MNIWFEYFQVTSLRQKTENDWDHIGIVIKVEGNNNDDGRRKRYEV